MIQDMALPRVAVLRGGMSNEYEVSMKTGCSVCQTLSDLGYSFKDITITRNGDWLDGGRVRTPEQALTGVDVVFIALHGEHGEDGRLQRYLSHHQIPYTGSRALASATALNKAFTKRLVASRGIQTPRSAVIERSSDIEQDVLAIPSELGERLVVKPLSCGSSLDTRVDISPDVAKEVVTDLLSRYTAVLVEQYIPGKEVTVGILEQFRDTPYYCLPPIEIELPQGEAFYNYNAKYESPCTYHCPGRLSKKEQQQVQEIAEEVHKLLDLRHYSRSDFIVADDDVYFLEVNTLPGLTDTSLFPKAMAAVGADYKQLISHLVANAHY